MFRKCALCGVLSVLVGAWTASGADVQLTFPAPATVVNSGTLVMADSSMADDAIADVSFQYSQDGIKWFATNFGPAPAFSAQRFGALWNALSLTPGQYHLRAVLTPVSGSRAYSVPVTVFVNAPPVARMTTAATATPYKLRFDASASSDPDGTVVSYEWRFGDGSVISGPVVEHQFPGSGAYPFTLMVTDNQDGSSSLYKTAVIAGQSQLFKIKDGDDCGCAKMTVKDAGDVDGPNDLVYGGIVGLPAAEKRKSGPWQDPATGDQLDMTKQSFTLGFRFEVVADLKPGSAPYLCEEGQRTKASTNKPNGTESKWPPNKVPGLTSDPRYDSSKSKDDPFDPNDDPKVKETGKCGFDDDKWCDDDYHGGGNARGAGKQGRQPPNGSKRYIGNDKIVWLDFPAVVGAPKTKIVAHGHYQKSHFESVVSGPGGKDLCKCTFDVIVEADKTGRVTKNKLENLKCAP